MPKTRAQISYILPTYDAHNNIEICVVNKLCQQKYAQNYWCPESCVSNPTFLALFVVRTFG